MAIPCATEYNYLQVSLFFLFLFLRSNTLLIHFHPPSCIHCKQQSWYQFQDNISLPCLKLHVLQATELVPVPGQYFTPMPQVACTTSNRAVTSSKTILHSHASSCMHYKQQSWYQFQDNISFLFLKVHALQLTELVPVPGQYFIHIPQVPCSTSKGAGTSSRTIFTPMPQVACTTNNRAGISSRTIFLKCKVPLPSLGL